MAEVIGLAASLIRMAGAGVKLSTSLYSFVGSASRADSDIGHIADGVQLTANTLDSIGKVFEREGGKCAVSRKAVQDAESLIKRCETVFAEIQRMIDKRWKTGKDERNLSTMGRFSWPLKEQRVELLKKRLESLNTSLQLLLEVILLANGQAKGEMENKSLEKERERIRELHQRQQDSLRALQALEHKLSTVSLSDDETLDGSSAPSRVPTIQLMVNASNSKPRTFSQEPSMAGPKLTATSTTLGDDSEPSGSEGTVTDDDGEHISAHGLNQCAGHVQKLLQRITDLQQSFEPTTATSSRSYPKHRVHKLYRRFCKKFETEMCKQQSGTVISSAPLPEFAPPSIEFFSKDPRVYQDLRIYKDPGPAPNDATSMWTLPSHPNHPRVEHQQKSTIGIPSAPPLPLLKPEDIHNNKQFESPHLLSKIYEDDTSRIQGTNARSDVSSCETSKEGNQSATEDDEKRALQETSEIHRTKTGRISKAKKGLKVHSCECGKSYTRAEHLRRHQKNHSSEDLVRCNLCGRAFYRLDLLERHIGRHKERLASHEEDSNYTMPQELGFSQSPGMDYTNNALQPTTPYGLPRRSTSSEASTPWMLPPLSDILLLRNTPNSEKQPVTIESDRAPKIPLRYPDPHQSRLVPTSQATKNPPSIQYDAHASRRLPQAEVRPTNILDGIPNNNSTHDRSSFAPPRQEDTESSRGSSRNFSGENSNTAVKNLTIYSQAGPDITPHHSGFTPVNPNRKQAPAVTQYSYGSAMRKGAGPTAGPSSEQRQIASQISSVVACANCKQLKQKCDTKAPCMTCLENAHRPGYLPESTCRGQVIAGYYTVYSQDKVAFGVKSPQQSKETGENPHGDVDATGRRFPLTHELSSRGPAVAERRSEFPITKPPPVRVIENAHNAPVDEVLQRLVKEAGPDKQLEKQRKDRKDFFNGHWAPPPPFLPAAVAREEAISLPRDVPFTTHGRAFVSNEEVGHSTPPEPNQEQVFGRSVRPCGNCERHKMSCDGKFPACTNCEQSGRADLCRVPFVRQQLGPRKDYIAQVETLLKSNEKTSDAPSYSAPAFGLPPLCQRCKELDLECDAKKPACTACEKSDHGATCSMRDFGLRHQYNMQPEQSPPGPPTPSSTLDRSDLLHPRHNHAMSRSRGPGGRLLTAEELAATEAHKAAQTTERDGGDAAASLPGNDPESKHAQTTKLASPPPEPADKNSEEWISWKRARISEGTKNSRGRKRGRAARVGVETEMQQRKKSKVEDGTNVFGDDTRTDGPTGGSINQRDKDVTARVEEEKDVVDFLLEQWTVPV